MDYAAVATALTAGMIAAFNPCGFALLPGYLALFLGDRTDPLARPIQRSLAVTGALTAGFIAVFGIAAIMISALAWKLSAYIPYLTLVFGPVLVGLGIWLLLGKEIRVGLPRLQASIGTNPLGMFIYGVVYATVSLSCTLPIFLIAVASSFRASTPVAAVLTLLAYAIGMGLVLLVLTLAVALARTSIVTTSRNLVRYVNRLSGVLLVLAGVYLTWYGYLEVQLLRGVQGATLPENFVTTWTSRISTTIDNTGGPTIAAVIIVAALVLLGLIAWRVRGAREDALGSRSDSLTDRIDS
ncbi:MAG: cytochrome c biogenesis protein CcdA [Actinobacteria bacterium]|nr:cytochrome c biogenesis protein CcdA [Actinomycetota bacterium]